MEKIKSVLKAAGAWCGRVAAWTKKNWPGASVRLRAAALASVAFLQAKPKLSGAAAILCVLAVGTCVRSRSAVEEGADGFLYEVKKGPLTISVVASGTIENKEKVVVRNEIEGAKATIVWLVEEGKLVQKGDLLVEMDAAAFEDNKLDAQIQLQNASSDVVRASETLAITKNQAQADMEKAELALKFAELAFKKYEEGDYPQLLEKARSDITIAEEELRRAEDRLAWSDKLFKEEFVTRSEYEADELAMQKKKIELDISRKSLEVLEKYTHAVDIEKLKSDVSQAKLAIDRVRRSAKADVLKAEVDLSAKEAGLGMARDRLVKLQDRIEKCRITAPVEGLVVYSTSVQSGSWRHRSEPLATGQTLEGREDLIHLPTTGGMIVKFDVQEGSLSKIEKGIPAVITVDAIPGRKFVGVVTKVSVLPDTGQSWLNPDLKVYNCEAEITSPNEGLRPGMSCTVEAIFQQLDDVLFVPIQSVVRVDDKPAVFVKGLGGTRAAKVDTGLDNNRMIHVVSGLEEGDKVLLAPPLAQAEKKSESFKGEGVPGAPAKPEGQREQRAENGQGAVRSEGGSAGKSQGSKPSGSGERQSRPGGSGGGRPQR